jgi:peptidoglycan hydrolase-like protein with peptidoglycan-binding domain
MPDPTPSTIRPVGLGDALWKLLKPGQSPAPAPKRNAPPMPRDSYSTANPFANRRFAAHADLAEVHRGGVLRAGSTSAGMAAVQRALIDMGFAVPGGAGGYYGAQTVQAIKNFQVMAGLQADGSLGPRTMAALDKYAPPPGKTAWDAGVDAGPVPSPDLGDGRKARIVVSISQHRAFAFDKAGHLEKIYGVRTGKADHADGRGGTTTPGVRVVTGKNSDPAEVSDRLWPESGGKAFGTRLIDLTRFDPKTNQTLSGSNGQELHGTYQEGSIGRDFSHGCVGLTNADIEEIYDNLRVGEFVRFDK